MSRANPGLAIAALSLWQACAGCGGSAPVDGAAIDAPLVEGPAGDSALADSAATDLAAPGDQGFDDGAIAADAAPADLAAAVDAAPAPDAAVGWRSKLYPVDWTPAFQDGQGRFLHDFSYAGYHNGEAPIPQNPPGKVVNAVLDFAADSTGKIDATVPIQKALDQAAANGGGMVLLPAGLYRVDGLLTVKASGIVLRGEGAAKSQVYFTKFQAMTDAAHLSFSGAIQQGPDVALASDGQSRSKDVLVADASSLHAGDDVALGWVITDGFIKEHGMTGTWMAFNGKWETFFRRKVVAIDLQAKPNRVTLDVPLRYLAKTRDLASLRKETGYLRECGIEALGIANAVDWASAWTQLRVHAIDFLAVKDGWIRGVESFASPLPGAMGFHLQGGGLRVGWSKRVTVADAKLAQAQNRGDGGCGYLFEISMTSEVLVRDSTGTNGRHDFIQNWGFGTSGCVFLRVESAGGRSFTDINDKAGFPAFDEYHHSLAMANLVDSSTLHDGWYGGNRGLESTGAGHSVTESAYWNIRGGGYLASWAYGWGYVIGADMSIITAIGLLPQSLGTEPEDWVEGDQMATTLIPQSLYADQLARRLNP